MITKVTNPNWTIPVEILNHFFFSNIIFDYIIILILSEAQLFVVGLKYTKSVVNTNIK